MRLHPGPPAAWNLTADLLARGQRAFAAGRFYEAQSLWEAEALVYSGEKRAAIQGLATIAAGMLALDEQRARVAERLLTRGRAMLAAAPEVLGGADVGAVRAAADVVVTALRRGDPASARGMVVPQP
jgi:predicted metal-dependent hydrolase